MKFATFYDQISQDLSCFLLIEIILFVTLKETLPLQHSSCVNDVVGQNMHSSEEWQTMCVAWS